MAWTFGKEYEDACIEFFRSFPGSTWGNEGCGLDEQDVIALMRESVANGVDVLTRTYPKQHDEEGNRIVLE